jgi:oligopeptide transport system substrate-binding protein
MKYSLLYLSFVLLLVSCGPNNKDASESVEGKGGVFLGGAFRMNELEDFKSLYPPSISEVVSQRITAQIYEGLVKLDPSNLSVVPGIASRWEHNDDLTKWTFHIRQNVKFHNDSCFAEVKGRAVVASDIKWCFDKLCEATDLNSNFEITFKDLVKGANEYFASTQSKSPLAGGVSGIHVVNDSTIEIETLHPSAGFLNILSFAGAYIYPREAWEKYGNGMREKCVGTGPFVQKVIKRGDKIVLERNPDYWGVDEFGNKLPYLDVVSFSFIKEKKSEMLAFQRGDLDMVFRLPIEMIPQIMGDMEHAKERKVQFEVQSVPALSFYYYGMLCTGDIFNKKETRLAFNYSIDREKLVNYTLQGEGIPGIYGVVPPSETFERAGYSFKDLKGYSYDPEKAKSLLAKAGYPNGKGFPKVVLQINSAGGERNAQIAEVIQKSLKDVLNINVEISTVPFAEHIDAYQGGKIDFFRAGWIADYPDPQTFLQLLYGKLVPAKASENSFTNSSRFVNARFDSLFLAAQQEPDITKRMDLFRRADQVALDEGALMPIYYEENFRLVQLGVKNFPPNGMEYRDLTKVYKVPNELRAGDSAK